MIDLGLARIARLVQDTPRKWKAVHVAGTNGKGSICAYVSALLHATSGGQPVGMFTSPHLIDRWDCITINRKPVSEQSFRAAEELVSRRNTEAQLGATEFELLTATAFEVFHQHKVKYGVVEVGLGGKLDATNVLDDNKAVTVISKIGLDHQSFLGSTLEDIARHKAGIMRPGVPCVVDDTNPAPVMEAIHKHAKEVGAEVVFPSIAPCLFKDGLLARVMEPHQIQNLACAYTAFQLSYRAGTRHSLSAPALTKLLPVIRKVTWPGRLQTIDISRVTGHRHQALLDGAHNVQSAQVLATYVQRHLRRRLGDHECGITWVLAASSGKDIKGVLNMLLQPEDRVAAVSFGPVDGMPWVAAEDPVTILDAASNAGIGKDRQFNGDKRGGLDAALKWASADPTGRPVVIAGSLYLVSDLLRRLRDLGVTESGFNS